jgi:hypothetical protein
MSLPDIDWTHDYRVGFYDGVNSVLLEFEKELYTATKEDPQYAAYVQDAIEIIQNIKPINRG